MSQTVRTTEIPTYIPRNVYRGGTFLLNRKRIVNVTNPATGALLYTYTLNASEMSFESDENGIVWNVGSGHISQDATHIKVFATVEQIEELGAGDYKFVLFRTVGSIKSPHLNVILEIK